MMRNKARADKKHTKQRFAERHGVVFGAKLLKHLTRQILSKNGVFVKKSSNSRSLWRVKGFDGKWYQVVYSKATKGIVTVFPDTEEAQGCAETTTHSLTGK